MLDTRTIALRLTDLSPRPWSFSFTDHVIRDATGANIASVPRHADLDWLSHAPETVEMLIEELHRLHRRIHASRRRPVGVFTRERNCL